MSAKAVRRIFDALEASRLRPVIDDDLSVVHGDCPACRHGDADPLGMHRPLSVSYYAKSPRVWCSSGCSDRAITAALQAGPTDWRAFAFELLDVANGLADRLDAATGANVDDLAMAVAA